MKLRPWSGTPRITFSSTTFPSSAVVVWRSSDCALTSMASVTSPTFRLTLRATVSLTPTVKAETLVGAKPAARR